MQQANPYQAPAADLSLPADGGHDESSVFSPRGRFGRLTYLAWSMLTGVVVWVLMAVVFGVSFAAGSPEGGVGMLALIGLLVLIPAVIFAIRRLHDFGSSGWWALLFIVPIVSAVLALVLLFRPGDEGANRFGPPRVTRGWEKVVAYIAIGFMVLALVGIIAAIAIPMLASS